MHNQQKSSLRDRRMLSLIQELGALTTEQVQSLCFSNIKSGKRKAQQRLKRMYDLGLVQRIRPALDSAFVYYPERRPGQLEHIVARNWVYCYLHNTLQWWEHLAGWYPESDYGVLRCDALAHIKNTVTDKHRFMFVEADLSSNRFDKGQKYTMLCRQGVEAWWTSYTDVFPSIMVVTETPSRLRLIENTLKETNPLGLRFVCYLLSELKKEAMTWKQNR